MMKAYFTLVLSFSLAFNIHAQEGQFSTPVKNKVSTNPVNILGKDNTGFFTAERHDKEQSVSITRYNQSNLKTEWTKAIAYGAGNPDMRLEEVVYLNNQFYLYTSTFHAESEQLRIYCTILNNTGTALGEPALVHYTLSEGREYAPDFGIELSPDKQKMLVYFDPPFERKTTEALSFKCYASDLDMLWEKEILLPYRADVIQVHQFALDNDLNLYMMSGRKHSDSFSKLDKVESGKYIMFYYNAKENKLKEYDVTLKDKQIASVGLRFDNNINIVIAGYYSLDYKINISGTFFYTFASKGGGVLAASFMPFKKETTEKYAAEKPDVIPNLFLKDIVILKDGNTLIIGEQQYRAELVINDPVTNAVRTETQFHFGDILVSKLEASGKHIMNTTIAKHQYSTDDLSDCSFAFYTDRSSSLFYYNDKPENIDPAKNAKWSAGSSSITMKTIISDNGNIIRDAAFPNKDKTYALKPFMSRTQIDIPIVLGYTSSDSYRFCTGK